MKLIEVSGTDYEMGKAIGNQYKYVLSLKAKKLVEELKDKELYTKVKNIRKKLKKDFPSILDEIDGRADGAQIDRDACLLMYSPELLWKKDGCTTVIMKDGDRDILFSHNEDDSDYKRNNTMLIKHVYKDHWTMGYTCAHKLIGPSFGFNSYGLLFSSNYIFDHGIDTDNISRYIFERYLYESTSIDDLRKRLKTFNVASPFSFNVVDINSRKAYNFEKDLVKVVETKITDRYARSNHFLTRKGEINKSKSSDFRYLKSKELIDKLDTSKVKLKDLKKVMDYHTGNFEKSIFITRDERDKSRTVANMTYSTKENVVIISDYLCNKVYEFYLSL